MLRQTRIFLASTVLMLPVLVGCQTGQEEPDSREFIIGVDSSAMEYALALTDAYHRQNPAEASWLVQTIPEEDLWMELDQNKIQAAMHLGESSGKYWTSSLGWTALVLVVNPQNKVQNLTSLQARDIFLGVIQDWSAIGGENGEIIRYSFSLESVMKSLLEKTVLDGNRLSQVAIAISGAWAMKDAIVGDTHGVGYLLCNEVRGGVVPLKIERKKMDYQALLKGEYPFRIPVLLSAQENPADDILRFVGWAQSGNGQSIFSNLCNPREE